MADSTKRTHTAWGLKQEGRRFTRWLEIGNGRVEEDEDGSLDLVHVLLDRLPIGGFNSCVCLAPMGTAPPNPEPPPPRRPGLAADEGEESES